MPVMHASPASPATLEARFTLEEAATAIDRAIMQMEDEVRPTWMVEEALSAIERALSETELVVQ